MPNGKIGDHPLSDIIVHGRTVYGRGLDGLIRELAAHFTTQELYGMFPWFDLPPRKDFERQLKDALARVEKQELQP